VKQEQGWNFTSLLITGEMRSGTTLVTNFLNSQEDCVVYADLLKVWFNEPSKLGLRSLSAPLSEREKNVLLSSLVAEGWKFGVSSFDEIERDAFDTCLGLYRLALSKLDPLGSAQVVGTKITRQYEYLQKLLDSGVKVIFCVRDPRDVLLSAKNRFSDYNLFERAISWKESISRAYLVQNHPSFYLLRFEDLLQEEMRHQEIVRLSCFLGIPLDAQVQTLVIRDGTEFVSNSSFGDVEEPFDSSALYRWKADKLSAETVFASRFLRQQILSLGYEYLQVDRTSYRRLYYDYLICLLKSKVRSFFLNAYRAIL
jgi:hypothetical protein